MASRKFRVDFYGVEAEQDFSLSDILQEIMSKNGLERIVEIEGRNYEIYDISTQDSFILGEIGQVNYDQIDPKVNSSGEQEAMPIGTDEGQIRQNFFVYEKNLLNDLKEYLTVSDSWYESTKETVNVPHFEEKNRVHNWRNYIPQPIKKHWGELPEETRILLFVLAEEQTDYEEWE